MVPSALTRLTVRFLLWPEEAFILKGKSVTAEKIAARVSIRGALYYAAMRGETNFDAILGPQDGPALFDNPCDVEDAMVVAAASGRAKTVRALSRRGKPPAKTMTMALMGNHVGATIELLRLGVEITRKQLQMTRHLGHHRLLTLACMFCAQNKIPIVDSGWLDLIPPMKYKIRYAQLGDAYRCSAAAEQQQLYQLGLNNRVMVADAIVYSGNIAEIRRVIVQGWAVTRPQQAALLANLCHNPEATLKLIAPLLHEGRDVTLTNALREHARGNSPREVIKALIDNGARVNAAVIKTASPELKKYLREFPRT
ncbi:MAG: hypothetical protein KGL39_01355 [Patescibacteria group bacterium]|nr:hypothetical protein [Patescibacteria group bacterium]